MMKTFLLVSAVAGVAWVGQGAPLPTYTVPAIREPHHNVMLENRYVRILDVTVPGFDSTLFHIHENPYVYVSIGAATLKAQVLGSNELTDLILKDGEVRYSPVVTHRVSNIVATPFRNITIQIQGRDTTGSGDAKPSPAATGVSAVLDNELIHVDRLVLGPGQSTGAHAHARSHLLVAVHGSDLQIEPDGQAVARLAMQPGDFDWHTGPYRHSITNVGASPFEAIEVVWK
jgi:hypothetical protein